MGLGAAPGDRFRPEADIVDLTQVGPRASQNQAPDALPVPVMLITSAGQS